ncbi:hypothetical protein SCG7109_AB_00690 [Chlamydiales bacterium SCGC AG-110-M15]|nr:hypothetical protein SCG7109_AB_00690 [Chlamydiales bacterium SCGC AG-110-M15]
MHFYFEFTNMLFDAKLNKVLNMPDDSLEPEEGEHLERISNDSSNTQAERPLECSECKKKIAVEYTEILGENVSHTCMCSDCPVLQQHLYGATSSSSGVSTDVPAGLCCGRCDTTLEAVRMGNPVGCEECYEVFADVLVAEMTSANKISHKIAPDKTKKSVAIHIGRSPGETAEVNPSLRLIALNEALDDVLKREDYEQAAWLRDQIKELEDKGDTPEKANEK